HNFQNYIQKNYPNFSNSIKLIENIYESTVNSSAILITNDWDEYKKVNYYNIYELMETPIIIDGRNILNPLDIKEIGFEYYSIGNNIK
ncbi:MAG: UDP binding domain-containing protein, partial [bacterium]